MPRLIPTTPLLAKARHCGHCGVDYPAGDDFEHWICCPGVSSLTVSGKAVISVEFHPVPSPCTVCGATK